MEMEKAFKAIEEVQEYLGLEPDNADLEDLVRCEGWLVSFYDDNGTFITLPSTKMVLTMGRLTTSLRLDVALWLNIHKLSNKR